MTIKRRLFISNIIMIGILLSAILANSLLDRWGVYAPYEHDPFLKNTEQFYQTITFIRESSDKWTAADNAGQLVSDIEQSDLSFDDTALSFALYNGETPIYTKGDFTENALFVLANNQPAQQHFTMDNTALYSKSLGNYHIYLFNNAYEYGESDKVEGRTRPFPFGIIAIVLIVLLANSILNKQTAKSILTPLSILVDGVHEIRDGNLNYRIQYSAKDEFVSTCEEFNEMAGQIQTLMEDRRKDDENRRELIAGISHDLSTPLTSIKAYVEGLLKGIASTPLMQTEYLQTISEKTDDLEHIVDQLFQFSKLDIGDFPFVFETLDIGNMMIEFSENAAGEYRSRGLQVLTDDIETDNWVRADSVQLRNVFTNLLENTIKYGNQQDNTILIGCKSDNGKVIITFQDNGPGVPEEQLDKLFDAFYRSDHSRRNPGRSSGLGLAISRIVIERSGGSIRAGNGILGGLKITVVLPVVMGGCDEENSDN